MAKRMGSLVSAAWIRDSLVEWDIQFDFQILEAANQCGKPFVFAAGVERMQPVVCLPVRGPHNAKVRRPRIVSRNSARRPGRPLFQKTPRHVRGR